MGSLNQQDVNFLFQAQVELPDKSVETDLFEFTDNAETVNNFGILNQKLKIDKKILHDGEINCISQQKDSEIVACQTNNGCISVIDVAKEEIVSKLNFHTQEGFTLDFNQTYRNQLLTGNYDSKLAIWDIEKSKEPVSSFNSHLGNIECVKFQQQQPQIFGSVGEDASFKIHDLREKEEKTLPISIDGAHKMSIYSLDFHPQNDILALTSSEDKTIRLWDMRNYGNCLHQFMSHQDIVTKVAWDSEKASVFTSASVDRRMIVWDMSMINQQQNQQEYLDGGPEILFIHGGHTTKINDFCQSGNSYLSVDDNNILQVWEIAQSIKNQFYQK